MVLVRDVFQCKFGQGGEVVGFLKTLFESQVNNAGYGISDVRILTDISGPYYTVVVELEMESVDAHQKLLHDSFAQADMTEGFARLAQAVDSGHRTYYNVEYANRG
jgi:hypothetical protein